MAYYVGALVSISNTFYNAAGTSTDPTATGDVYFYLLDPHGVLTSYHYGVDAALLHDAAGTFHVVVSLSLSGIYHYGFRCTGTTLQTAIEDTLTVASTAFPL